MLARQCLKISSGEFGADSLVATSADCEPFSGVSQVWLPPPLPVLERFFQKLSGLLDHLLLGKLSVTEFAVYVPGTPFKPAFGLSGDFRRPSFVPTALPPGVETPGYPRVVAPRPNPPGAPFKPAFGLSGIFAVHHSCLRHSNQRSLSPGVETPGYSHAFAPRPLPF